MRARPASDFGPVDNPPWNRQRAIPCSAPTRQASPRDRPAAPERQSLRHLSRSEQTAIAAGVDGGKHAVLLPVDPDRSAAKLRRELKKQLGIGIAVIVSDSFGRPWREGLTEVAIGVAGMRPLEDYRGRRDPQGYSLHATIDAVADELACAAGLVCGKLERTPACIIRGFSYRRGNGSARELVRPAKNDLFR